MQLSDICDIELDAVSCELVADVHRLARQVNELRPLAPHVIERIQRELIGIQVFNSNAIEGSTLSLRETKGILEAAQVSDVGRQREGQAAFNLGRAIGRLQDLVRQGGAFADEREFLSAHKILFEGIDDDWAGRYRNDPRMITGAKYQPPDLTEVPELMKGFFQQLKSASDVEPVLVASWVHWVIARVHPFADGNGRMARLWQDLILFAHKLVPAVIRQDQRTVYYEALEAADGGQFDPLVQLVTQSLTNTLQMYVNAQQEEDEVSGWASEIVGEVDERVDDRRKLEYVHWSHHMRFLRDAFERCASQINKASDGKLLIQVHSYPVIEQATWETLRAGTGASQTWFFRVFGRRDNLSAHYVFFFGHHFYCEEDSQLAKTGPSVCLLISEQVGKEESVRLDELEDAPVTVRELLVIDKRVVRRRWDREAQTIVYDDDITPLTVAQDFLKEVILNRLSV